MQQRKNIYRKLSWKLIKHRGTNNTPQRIHSRVEYRTQQSENPHLEHMIEYLCFRRVKCQVRQIDILNSRDFFNVNMRAIVS